LSFVAFVPLASILYLVVKNGLPLLDWSVFRSLPPAAGMTGGGFGNAVIGTLVMVGLGLALSAPPGILAAIYICEYQPKGRLAGMVRFVAKLLTGIPSIICGVFAFAAVVLSTSTDKPMLEDKNIPPTRGILRAILKRIPLRTRRSET
jgi:phosphate transport system permease protein